MITIQTTKGYDLPVQGAPLETLETPPPPETVGVLPDRIPFIKPRLAVGKGAQSKPSATAPAGFCVKWSSGDGPKTSP